MATIFPIKGISPVFGTDNWLAPTATIVGDFVSGEKCTFWFNSVIRADVNSIRFGEKVNVQDGACVHCTFQKFATLVGNNVSIGHHAIVHGCTIEDNVLIGMGAIIMDGAIVRKNSIIAAGAVVLEGTEVESGAIYAGIPAKKVKQLSEEQTTQLIQRIANNYIMYADWYK
jgi:carbonic anhydrase/acetyltransferase-like protein (isoleucine patch superfamily)